MGKRYYYIGEGVFNHGGKDYGFGEELPADVPEASIQSMLTKKKVSETAPAGGGTTATDDSAPLKDEILRLQGRVAGLQEELETVTAKGERTEEDLKRCAGAFNQSEAEVKRLQGELEAAGEKVRKLEGDLDFVTGERDAARATILERDKTINDLTTQLMAGSKGKGK